MLILGFFVAGAFGFAGALALAFAGALMAAALGFAGALAGAALTTNGIGVVAAGSGTLYGAELSTGAGVATGVVDSIPNRLFRNLIIIFSFIVFTVGQEFYIFLYR
jgi:hypothetical protein